MNNSLKANAIITSIDDVRGLWDTDVQPLLHDRVFVSRYTGEGNDKLAICTNLSRTMKPFGLPESSLRKITYKPLYKFEYKKESIENISESYLDKMGAEGWELVTIESGGFSKYQTVYFKRIIHNEEII